MKQRLKGEVIDTQLGMISKETHEPLGRKLDLIHSLLQLDDERKMTTLDFRIELISNNNKGFILFLFLIQFNLESSFKFTAKPNGRYREFPCTTRLHRLTASPPSAQSGIFVTIQASALTYHCYSNSEFLFILKYAFGLSDLFIFFTQL